MKNFSGLLIRILLGYSGPVLVVYHIYLFKHYFSRGALVPDQTYAFMLNNHGINRYITEQQDRALDLSLLAAVIMMIVFFVMISLRIRRRND